MNNLNSKNKTTLVREFLALAVIFLILTGALVGFRYKELRGIFILKGDWLTAKGFITSSEVTPEVTRGRTYWHYKIQYQYSVNGSAYQSDQVSFSYTGAKDPTYAQTYTTNYPVGKEVVVYYLPEEPVISVLEPENKWVSVFYGTVGIGLLSLLCFVVAYWRYRKDIQTQ